MFDGILPAEDRPLGDPETPGNGEGLYVVLRGSLLSLFVIRFSISDQFGTD